MKPKRVSSSPGADSDLREDLRRVNRPRCLKGRVFHNSHGGEPETAKLSELGSVRSTGLSPSHLGRLVVSAFPCRGTPPIAFNASCPHSLGDAISFQQVISQILQGMHMSAANSDGPTGERREHHKLAVRSPQ